MHSCATTAVRKTKPALPRPGTTICWSHCSSATNDPMSVREREGVGCIQAIFGTRVPSWVGDNYQIGPKARECLHQLC